MRELSANPRLREVTYVGPGGTMWLRMTEEGLTTMCRAADALKARYFIARDGWDEGRMLPVWGVFDMRTAQRNNPVPGVWSISDPIRTFTTETADGAVMYALALMSK